MIRVLVAEDSAAVRALLVEILNAADNIEVVGEATNGNDVVQQTQRLHPDVITMDIHMPILDGLAATELIMRTAPTPIVIVSSAVQQSDLEMTMRALQVGAVAAIPKPEHPSAEGFDDYATQLIETVRAMAQIKVVRRRSPLSGMPTPTSGVPVHTEEGNDEPAIIESPHQTFPAARIVAIATSTGGPAALQTILSTIPKSLSVPVLVVQHIATGFVPALVGWLNQTSALPVVIAESGVPLQGGMVYVAPNDAHLGVAHDHILLSREGPIGGFRPSGTYLFRSVSAAFGEAAMGVILTGMGRDGVEGLRVLRAAGGFVVAQNEKTSVVFGMPAEAVQADLVDRVLPLGQISAAIAARVGSA
ncbi:MAG TPA: chemotaxis-specific protein-glutamate methyltransferase CheB [Gemmatimonadaceae bacterium]|jgi:two-component system chemotaxis response regulator CheB|nr:chemotaxis-specific protein-glutamate methyltransferase CheB [Gemmatimonadaceae bacterium]